MLKDFLTQLTVDKLKELLTWIPNAPKISKKDDLIAAISRILSLEALREIWRQLDDMQRLAVAEAAYSYRGTFNSAQFHAKYGKLPDFTCENKHPNRYSYSKSPSRLGLLLYWWDGSYHVPSDLLELLVNFIPKPDGVKLPTAELNNELDEKTLTIRYCEREAYLDLGVLLRLAEQGNKLQVGDKTGLPSAATMRLLTAQLANGDYYVDKPRQHNWDQEIGSIKAFSWPILLQSAGLVQRHASKLTLSSTGLKALRAPQTEVIKAIWNKWLKSTMLDEFSRIDIIKGQKSKGRVMTAVAGRREAIIAALRCCPVNAWVNLKEFSRFMVADDHHFEVAHTPWKLYVCDPHYGHLGYTDSGDWNILQLRYLMGFLFEYAAPLGLIDIAYIDPNDTASDYGNLWGTDDLDFLSRYDGLSYFRLTPLGAFCLGLSKDYTPTAIETTTRLSVLPSLHIHVTSGELTTEESLLLDAWAEKTEDQAWRLDRQRAIRSIEKGLNTMELIDFLKVCDDQPLPESVESFLRTCQLNGSALKIAGSAILIHCHDTKTATTIATHKETAGLCLKAGEQQLVVRLEHEKKFRNMVNVLGFGIAA